MLQCYGSLACWMLSLSFLLKLNFTWSLTTSRNIKAFRSIFSLKLLRFGDSRQAKSYKMCDEWLTSFNLKVWKSMILLTENVFHYYISRSQKNHNLIIFLKHRKNDLLLPLYISCDIKFSAISWSYCVRCTFCKICCFKNEWCVVLQISFIIFLSKLGGGHVYNDEALLDIVIWILQCGPWRIILEE